MCSPLQANVLWRGSNGSLEKVEVLDMSNISHIPRVIMACCVLHNVCLMSDDVIDVPPEDEDIDVQFGNATKTGVNT